LRSELDVLVLDRLNDLRCKPPRRVPQDFRGGRVIVIFTPGCSARVPDLAEKMALKVVDPQRE
jgi:hypothetical protein